MSKKVLLSVLLTLIPLTSSADNLGGGRISSHLPPLAFREEATSDLVRPRVVIMDIGSIADNLDGTMSYSPASSDLVEATYLKLDASNDPITGDLTLSSDLTISGATANLYIESLTTGSVLFSNGSKVTEDNSNLFWDDTNNRLGIATNSPSVELDVVGDTEITGSLGVNVLPIGAIAAIGDCAFDGNVTINDSSADKDFRVESNGDANMLFIDGGNDRVGIGTTSPSVKLDVVGDASISQDLTIFDSLVVDSNTLFADAGKVGIGTVTPSEVLHVVGDRLLADDTPHDLFYDTDTSTGFMWHLDEDAVAVPWQGLNLWDISDAEGTIASNRPLIHFDTNNNTILPSDTGQKLLWWKAQGHLALGDSFNPNLNLHIKRDMDGVVGFRIENPAVVDGISTNAQEYFCLGPSGTEHLIFQVLSTVNPTLPSVALLNHFTHDLYFRTNSVNVFKSFRIGAKVNTLVLDTGKVGIGDGSPDAPLEILSTANPQLLISNTDGVDSFSIYNSTDGDTGLVTSGDQIYIQNATDGTTGFTVYDVDGGAPVFNVNTEDEFVGINTNAPLTSLHILSKNAWNNALGQVIFQAIGGQQVGIGGVGIYRRDTASDASNLNINYYGYNGGTTYYRDLKVWDGKAGQIAMFDGSSGDLGVGATPDTRLEVSDTDAQLKLTHTAGVDEATFGVDSDGYFQLNSTGNRVGIEATPSACLDVGGGTVTTIDGTDDLLVKDDAEIDGDAYIEGSATITSDLTLSGTAFIGQDLLFNVAEGGLPFGEIYAKDNTDAMTLNSAAKVQVTVFNTNGHSNNTSPDHTNDHITIIKAGKYLVTVSIAVQNNAAQSHKVEFGLWKNNGATAFTNVHAHRNLSGGSTDVGSISLSGIIDVSVNDTLEIWGNTSDAADRSVTVEDITLSITEIGG